MPAGDSKTPIRAVLFDFFGVLYVQMGEDFYSAHVPDFDKYRDQLQKYWDEADMGQHTHEDVVQYVARLSGLDSGLVRRGILGGLVRNQAMLDFGQTLRADHKLGVLTNMSSGLMDTYFTQAELSKYFDVVVISSQEGVTKPNPEIYRIAAARLGMAVDECLLLDDTPANCAGAMAVGMQAVIYENTAQAIQAVKKLIAV